MVIMNYKVIHLQRLSYKQALKEWNQHGDEPAKRTLFSIRQSVHHGEIPGYTAGSNNQCPANKDKPPRQPSLTAFLRWVSALFHAGGAIDLNCF